MRRQHANSTAGAPNGKSGFNGRMPDKAKLAIVDAAAHARPAKTKNGQAQAAIPVRLPSRSGLQAARGLRAGIPCFSILTSKAVGHLTKPPIIAT